MDPERWRRVETLVASALGMTEGDRDGFLEAACAGDDGLRAEVERLLAFESGAAGFLEGFAAAPPGAGVPDGGRYPDPLIGRLAGPYRITRRVGRGGMGSVYLAERADGEYRQTVAVKVLHAGMLSRDLLRRFRAERQILAALDHPGICRLLDGGATADGRPFLAMEHVDGRPLDRFCDENDLGVEDRVGLLLKVCDAVSHAHRRLVIHRDLKPGNILVTNDGEPKLLDFGIAKLLDAGSTADEDLRTRTRARLMSPAYASPEQILGRPVGTASDVFSLGVVLYRLLTGVLPRRLDDASPVAMARALELEPAPPSQAATGAGARSVARRLRGDLDAIALKALRSDPEARYQSAHELAEDLRRWLRGLPVVAREGSTTYLAGKLLRRYAPATAVAAVVGILTAAAVAELVLQNRQIRRERDRAQGLAELSAGLLEIDELAWVVNPDLDPRQVLRKNLDDRERSLAIDPVVRRDQLLLLSRGHLLLGDFSRTEPLLSEAMATLGEAGTVDEALRRRILVDTGVVLIRAGRLDDARSALLRALEIPATDTPEDRLEISRAHSVLGVAAWAEQDPAGATRHLDDAHRMTAQVLGPDHVKVAELEAVIALLTAAEAPGTDEALRRLEGSLEALGADWTSSLYTPPLVRAIVEELVRRRELGGAVNALIASRWMWGQLLGEDELSSMLARLACLSLVRGNSDRAGQYRGAPWVLLAREESKVAEQIFVSIAIDLELGDLAGAEAGLGSLDHWLRHSIFPERSLAPKLATSLLQVGRAAVLLRRGEPGRALTILERSEDPRPAGGIDPLLEAWLTASRAEALLANCQPRRAEAVLDEARAAWAEAGSRWSVGLVRASFVWIGLLIIEGRTIEAAAALEDLREVVERQHTVDPCRRTTEQLAALALLEGDLHGRRGEGQAAEARWREAVWLLEPGPAGTPGADHRLTLGEAYLRLGREEEARLAVQPLVELGWRWPGWVARIAGETGRDRG